MTTANKPQPVMLSYQPDEALKKSGYVPLADVAAMASVRLADLEWMCGQDYFRATRQHPEHVLWIKRSDVSGICAEVVAMQRVGAFACGGIAANEGGTNLTEPQPQAYLLAKAVIAREQEQRTRDEAEQQRQQARVKAQAAGREIQFRAATHKAEQHLAEFERMKREASLRRVREIIGEHRAKQEREARERQLFEEGDRIRTAKVFADLDSTLARKARLDRERPRR